MQTNHVLLVPLNLTIKNYVVGSFGIFKNIKLGIFYARYI